MWLYVAFAVVTVGCLFIKRSFWEHNGIPSVPGYFFVGSILDVLFMKKHFGILAHEWYKKFSDLPYFGYYYGSTPVLMIRDIDVVKDILIKEFNSFGTNEFQVDETLDPILGTNPFMSSGEKWKHYRSQISPVFSASKIKSVFPLMKTTCTKLEDYLNVHGSTTLSSRDLATKFTIENIVMCGFTFNAETFTNPDAEFLKIDHELFGKSLFATFQLLIAIFVPFVNKYLRIPLLPKYVDKFFRNFIKSNIASREHVPADDFLQTLLQHDGTKKVSEMEAIGHSLSYFAEGYETSNPVISYGMFELAKNPDIQNKLYVEVTDTLAEFNGELNYEALQKMEYMDEFFYETMRFYPVILSMHKICTQPYEFKPLPGKKIGYKMRKGEAVAIPVHAIHYDPEFYPNPEVFNPDRFLPEQRKTIPKCAFLAFGDGPRMCIGMRFAQTQAKAALVTIVKTFSIKLSPETKPYQIDPKVVLNSPLDPILLNFEKR